MVNTAANSAPPGIVFIGGGNMASALIGGLLRAGRPVEAIAVIEPFEEQRARLAQQFGVQAQAAAAANLAGAATVVWAVKPQLFHAAAAPCAPFIGTALQVSVMAGVRCAAIASATCAAGAGGGSEGGQATVAAAGAGGGAGAIVRSMPNTPALIGRGIAGLFAQPAVSAAQRAEVEALFAPTGATLWLAREVELDAVTALSGSGPAYVFYVLEALIDAATAMGLSPAQGRQLALATFDGATSLAERSPLAPAALRAQVTSKGGTTHAAIGALDAAGVHAAFVHAVQAAQARARALGDEFGA